jgi:IS1 family transposase
MNTLSTEKRKQVVAALVEGMSIRATVRMTGVAKKTVMRILAEVGEACWTYQQLNLKNLPCKRIQCDEIWSFVGGKDKNMSEAQKNRGLGSAWTWTALCADSKLMVSFFVGKRDAHAAHAFMKDIAARVNGRIQLTTDGNNKYLDAVDNAFGDNIDYARLIKIYGDTPGPEGKYSPGECCSAYQEIVKGNPNDKHTSTSFVERQNLTLRMQCRRFTRLTNAFSKKLKSLQDAVALHFMHYNFCRIHQTLRCTPAMKAGVTTRVWEIEDILELAYGKSSQKASVSTVSK